MGDKHGDKDACDWIILSDTTNILWLDCNEILPDERSIQQLPPVQVLRTAKETIRIRKFQNLLPPIFESRLRQSFD